MAKEDGSAPEGALAELRTRLEFGLAEQGVTKTALARRAGLGRTAVSEAFNRSASAPSARTIGALGRALRLDVQELLDLRASAAGVQPATPVDDTTVLSEGIGQPIANFDPHDLEVHPAIDIAPGEASLGAMRSRRLPGYVRRRHDREMDDLVEAAAEGYSGVAMLVGPSSTGKTRACWEAIQPLAPLGWRLWHPFDPTRAEAALNDLQHVGPRTVVWLNEAQHYLGSSRGTGQRIAAALRSALADRRVRPVLILGTLWNDYATEYTTLPTPGRPDPYAQTRELLAGRLIILPDSFDVFAIRDARIMAREGDFQLAQALKHAQDGRLTQYLAGAPALLERYKIATPPVRALIQAAMDARRLGTGSHINVNFLGQAARDYLTDHERSALGDNWLNDALQEGSIPVHGNLAPLTPVHLRGISQLSRSNRADRIETRSYKLADSLEQYGRTERRMHCPPESFWEAAHEWLTDPTELANIATAAHDRYRLSWASRLTGRAAEQDDASTLARLADMWVEGHPEYAERLCREAAELGNASAMDLMAFIRKEAGDQEGAKEWYRKASEAGDRNAILTLAEVHAESGDPETAERLYRRAVDLGNIEALNPLSDISFEQHGDVEESISLLQRSICARLRQTARLSLFSLDTITGSQEASTKPWHSRKETEGSIYQLEERGDAGDLTGFLQAATDASRDGDTYGLFCLYFLLGMKDQDEADKVLESAAKRGNSYALIQLATEHEKRGKLDEAEALYRSSINSGDNTPLTPLADLLKKVGNSKEAESLYWQAIESGNIYAMRKLSKLKEESGDRAGAEELALQAANAGDCKAIDELWRHGLDPDGTPTSGPW